MSSYRFVYMVRIRRAPRNRGVGEHADDLPCCQATSPSPLIPGGSLTRWLKCEPRWFTKADGHLTFGRIDIHSSSVASHNRSHFPALPKAVRLLCSSSYISAKGGLKMKSIQANAFNVNDSRIEYRPISSPSHQTRTQSDKAMGNPLDIRQVAQLIGCSTWTVRQTLIPRGLPHLRFSPHGRLTFYTVQVIIWIETEQAKIAATTINPRLLDG